MKKYIHILVALLCLVVMTAFRSPGRLVQGRVVSFSEPFPIEGVRVQVKGTTVISGTLPDGIFFVGVQPSDTILVFSLVGYQAEEVKLVPKQQDYIILLKSL